MVNQSLTTRLAQERLTTIKIHIVRDRVRKKLQQRQELQTNFAVGTEEMFKPITSATKDVKTATERAIYGNIVDEERKQKTLLLGVLKQIAAETEQTSAAIQPLSSDINPTSV